MGDVRNARTVFPGIQVVVTQDQGLWIPLMQLLKQPSHGSLLFSRPRIGGLTADIQPALVADADGVGVVVLAVGTCQPFRPAWFDRSVTTDHVVVADAELPTLTAMPCVDLRRRTGLAALQNSE